MITDYRVILPWPEQEVGWGFEADEVLPKSRLDRYGELGSTRLSAVLEGRAALYRGSTVEGLLCGRAWTPFPRKLSPGRLIGAEVILVDHCGVPIRLRAELSIVTIKNGSEN